MAESSFIGFWDMVFTTFLGSTDSVTHSLTHGRTDPNTVYLRHCFSTRWKHKKSDHTVTGQQEIQTENKCYQQSNRLQSISIIQRNSQLRPAITQNTIKHKSTNTKTILVHCLHQAVLAHTRLHENATQCQVQYEMQTCQERFFRQYSQSVLVVTEMRLHHHFVQQNQELSERCLADDQIPCLHRLRSHRMTPALPTLLYTALLHSSFWTNAVHVHENQSVNYTHVWYKKIHSN